MACWCNPGWRSALALTVSLSVAVSSSAFAHSSALTPTPARGAVLLATPTELKIPFDGPMRVITTTLTRANGESFDVAAQAGRSASETLVVVPPALPDGRYTLEWRGLSEDGHTMTGELSFRVDAD